jgi:hypothetical protein
MQKAFVGRNGSFYFKKFIKPLLLDMPLVFKCIFATNPMNDEQTFSAD